MPPPHKKKTCHKIFLVILEILEIAAFTVDPELLKLSAKKSVIKENHFRLPELLSLDKKIKLLPITHNMCLLYLLQLLPTNSFRSAANIVSLFCLEKLKLTILPVKSSSLAEP